MFFAKSTFMHQLNKSSEFKCYLNMLSSTCFELKQNPEAWIRKKLISFFQWSHVVIASEQDWKSYYLPNYLLQSSRFFHSFLSCSYPGNNFYFALRKCKIIFNLDNIYQRLDFNGFVLLKTVDKFKKYVVFNFYNFCWNFCDKN